MKALARYIALVLCLLCAYALHAQESTQTVFSLSTTADGQYEMLFTMGHFECRATVDGYCELQADDMVNLAPDAGLPALPQSSRLLTPPRGTVLELERWTSQGSRTTALASRRQLQPWQGATLKDFEPQWVEPDKAVYAIDTFYRNGDPVSLEHLGTMGDCEVYRLTVRPFAYNPSTREISVHSALQAILHTTATPLLHTSGIPQPERYVVVSRPAFREELQSFVQWKRRQGYEVVELYADTNRRDDVKAMIAPLFGPTQPQWPRHLLLVGDVAQLQAYIGTTRPAGTEVHITDLYYAEYTGDYLPDVLIGRWPVGDTAELRAVVEKTVRYEQGLDLDSNQLKRLLLVAGTESQAPAPVTTNGQVNYLARELKAAHPDFDTLTYRNPASATQRQEILDDLGQGVALLNYTAHCTAAGWSTPAVSIGSIDTLDATQPLLYVNNCCLSNAFGGTCFGEQLLRLPSGGAIGVIGATNSTLWVEDYYWAVGPKDPPCLEPLYDSLRPGAFDRWLGQSHGVLTQGELLVAGNLAVSAYGSPYDRFYWETYCLLGDPSLEPWVGLPQTIELHTTNGAPTNGASSLYLGGTAGATVTALQHDTVLGIGTISPEGLLVLQLCQSLDTTPLILTATAPRHRPHIDTLQVLSAEGIGVALREVVIGDSVVTCRVENVGTTPLYGLHIVLDQLDADSAINALVTGQMTAVDTLLPHQSRLVTLPVEVTSVGTYPYWRAQLFAWDSIEGILCCLTLQQTLDIHYPSVSFRLLNPDGHETNRLLPQRTYTLETTVEGDADSCTLLVTALPTGDTLATLNTPFVTPDTLMHLRLQATLNLGHHRNLIDHYLVGGQRMDSFEAGLGSYPWQVGGTLGWQVDSTHAHSGRRSLRSGAIGNHQTSDLELEVVVLHADTLRYWASTSSESNYDKLLFTVDGVPQGYELWGESAWRQFTIPMTAGHHLLRWRYVKDDSGSEGSDCAWIDDVRLPLALWDSAYGWFGDTDQLGPAPTPDGLLQPYTLYPNPSHGDVILAGPTTCSLQVHDIYGREVYTHPAPIAPHSTLRLDFLPDGMYLLTVATPTTQQHLKLIIRH